MCPFVSDEADTQKTWEMITCLAGFNSLDDILQNLRGQKDLNFVYFILLDIIKNCLVFRHNSTEMHKLLYWKSIW